MFQKFLCFCFIFVCTVPVSDFSCVSFSVFLEVWDVKYNRKHSEAKVDLSTLGQVQHVRCTSISLLFIRNG